MAFGPVNVPGKLTAADIGAAAVNHSHSGYASTSHSHTASQVGAVPTSRKVNNKPLSADISLTATDVGAAAANHSHSGYATANHFHTAADVGAAPASHSHSNYLLTSGGSVSGNLSVAGSVTVNSLGFRVCGEYTPLLSSDGGYELQVQSKKINFIVPPGITGSPAFTVNGSADSFLSAIGAARASHSHTPADVGAAAACHSHTAADVGALPISGGTLTGNLTLKGASNYGTKINLGNGDLVHISEPADDVMELKAKEIRLVTTASPALKLNGTALIGAGTTDLTAGSSALATGCIYCVYE